MNEINFEEAIAGLEAQVRRLGGGNMTIDESITAFEEAVKLVKICNERLENAERRVRILVEGADGTVSDAAFDSEDEN